MTTYKMIANYELQKSNREKSIANHETVISNLEITFNMVGKEINIITDEIQAHKKGVWLVNMTTIRHLNLFIGYRSVGLETQLLLDFLYLL